jgi:hypothetical protein
MSDRNTKHAGVTISAEAYARLLRDRRAFLLATARSSDPKRNAADRAYYRRQVAKP